jgi:branched-chain amino acid transport system substrate-binding protein
VLIHSVWAQSTNFTGLLAGEEYDNETFIADYTAAMGAAPDEDEALPFAVCQGMEQAIIGTGGTDNATISEWMHSRTPEEPVRTIMGDYVWDERGLPAARDFLINQWQEGQLAFVFPVGEFPGTVDMVYPKPEW